MTAPAEDPRGGEADPCSMACDTHLCDFPKCLTPRHLGGGELRSHAQRLADEAAALDYAETALDEAWAVLRRIAEGSPDPARVAADLLEAHGHVLPARPAGDRAQPTQELREAIRWKLARRIGASASACADDVLALPEVAALLDAQATVNRVEALVAAWRVGRLSDQGRAFDLRRALDGTTT